MSTTTHSWPGLAITKSTFTATKTRTSAVIRTLPLSLSRLIALLEEHGEDDYGKTDPSQFAFLTAIRLVSKATSILGVDVVPCSPSVDSEGGIRVTWRRGNKQIKLICPATPQGPFYIYQSSGDENSVWDKGVSAVLLAEKLDWLMTRESTAIER